MNGEGERGEGEAGNGKRIKLSIEVFALSVSHIDSETRNSQVQFQFIQQNTATTWLNSMWKNKIFVLHSAVCLGHLDQQECNTWLLGSLYNKYIYFDHIV